MRTIYVNPGRLSRRFSVACAAKQQRTVATNELNRHKSQQEQAVKEKIDFRLTTSLCLANLPAQ
jgi:hypothetical protein